ncbi:methyltransferase [Cupriavidus sp. HPC(L)]|uniref:class I SAM-dependent methyltransferase n=1 Tax=Cupriavidus sp. HPC(L) TaxID=1217418 RepID=UPI0002913B9E|nr:class I SAM-dependent methyltransferase [Cupriavidus sp. HPC(L)]ESJ10995.1 methyltransferase [Cupriavidus sp. HPC(L)]
MSPQAYLEMAQTEADHWWFRARRDIVAAVLAQLALPPGAAILEIGAGTGGNLDMLARFGTVSGLEMDAMARRLAVAKTAGRYPIADGRCPDTMPFRPGSFDLVCLLDCLEHIADDAGALLAVRGLLRPGGAALMTVPAHPWLWSRHDVFLHHQRRYRRTALSTRLGNAGLRVETLSYFNTVLFPLAVAARWHDRLRDALHARHPEHGVPGEAGGSTGTAMPPALLNALLYALFRSERLWLRHGTLPFGVSLLAVARAV